MHIVGLKDPNRVVEIRDNLKEIIKLFDAVLDNKATMKSVS